MPFLTLTNENLRREDPSQGYVVFISPGPSANDLPAVWLDLHVADEYYQDTDDTNLRRSFKTCKSSGRRYVFIGAKRGVRLVTQERVGCDTKHTGIVMNVASRAKHGLIVAPGKIDPGFAPNRLVLVIFNQSNRRVRLWAGDKIASVAFAHVEGVCPATESRGHANGVFEDFSAPWRQRVAVWLASCDYRGVLFDVFKLVAAAGLALLVAWLTGYLGFKKP